MIEATVEKMYSDDDENQFLEVTYANGDKEVLYFKDFSSGAMIENIVRRAKKMAIKRAIAGEPKGINDDDMIAAHPPGVQGERGSAEHDEPRRLGARSPARRASASSTSAPWWASSKDGEGPRQVERVQTGQYL